MPLVLVPIGAPVDGGAPERSAIEEFLALACSSVEGQSTLREPVWVVPDAPTGWDSCETLESFVERQIVVINAPDGTSDFETRLRHALTLANAHVGGARHRPGAEDLRPVTVVMPLIVAGHAFSDALHVQFEGALTLMRKVIQDVRAEDSSRLLPWLFVSSQTDADRLWDFASKSAEPLRMILHAAHTAAGTRSWEAVGNGSLIADLLAFHALSALEAKFDEWFPDVRGSFRRSVIYSTHSALLECPLPTILLERVLGTLRRSASGTPVLPSTSELDALVANAAAGESLRTDVDDQMQDLVSLIDSAILTGDEIKLPEVVLRPSEGEWAELLSLPEVPAVAPVRVAPDLHAAFAKAFAQRASLGWIQDRVQQGLDDSLKRVTDVRRSLQTRIQNALGAADGVRPAGGGIGQALAWLDLSIQRCRTVQTPELALKADDLDKLVETARAMRDQWCEKEEQLLAKTAQMPSSLAILLEMAGAFLGLASATASLGLVFWLHKGLPAIASTSLLFGASAAWVVRWWRLRGWKRLNGEWRKVEQDLQREVDGLRQRLVQGINARARHIKAATAGDLARSLTAVRARLELELAGLLALIDDQHASLYQQSVKRADREKTWANRRTVRVPFMPLESDFSRRFHDAWTSLLRRVVTLVEAPNPVTLHEYRKLLEAQVQNASTGAYELDLKREILAGVRELRDRGTDVTFLPALGVGRNGTLRAFGLAGEFCARTLEGDDKWGEVSVLAGDQWGETESASVRWLRGTEPPFAHVLAADVAVVLTCNELIVREA